MSTRAPVENADTVSLVCALLVRFPELASIRSGPADRTVRLTFAVRQRHRPRGTKWRWSKRSTSTSAAFLRSARKSRGPTDRVRRRSGSDLRSRHARSREFLEGRAGAAGRLLQRSLRRRARAQSASRRPPRGRSGRGGRGRALCDRGVARSSAVEEFSRISRRKARARVLLEISKESEGLGSPLDRLNLLIVGDVVGSPGREVLKRCVALLREQHAIHACIANGENAAGGFGLTAQTAEEMFASGVDFITGGNHTFDKRDFAEYLESSNRVIRPANYPPGVPGRGAATFSVDGVTIGVLNLMGRTFMPPVRRSVPLLPTPWSTNCGGARRYSSSTFMPRRPRRKSPLAGISTAAFLASSARILTFRPPTSRFCLAGRRTSAISG